MPRKYAISIRFEDIFIKEMLKIGSIMAFNGIKIHV